MSTAASEIEIERARSRNSNAERGMVLVLSDRDRQRRELQARADRIAGELKDLYLRTRALEREQNEVDRLMREL